MFEGFVICGVDFSSSIYRSGKIYMFVDNLASLYRAEHGFERMAKHLNNLLIGTIRQQARADLMVAELIRASRAYARGEHKPFYDGGSKYVGVTELMSMSKDQLEMDRWMQAEAKARGFEGLRDLGLKNPELYDKLARLYEKKFPEVRFSRAPTTKAADEARIDELFSGGKANRVGVRVLDKSDVLDMLGMGNKPVVLQEGSVSKAPNAHPRMIADAWKKVPEWLEKPAAVFESDTDGGLVFIGPELVNGAPVRMIVEPDGRGAEQRLKVSLLVNAYDAPGKAPFLRWISEGKLHYADKKRIPSHLCTIGRAAIARYGASE
jgi:hypothetical protein